MIPLLILILLWTAIIRLLMLADQQHAQSRVMQEKLDAARLAEELKEFEE